MLRNRRIAGALFVVAAMTAGSSGRGSAGESVPPTLHERIDRMIDARCKEGLASPATDAEFLRRAWLDLAGMIPTVSDARAFLDDPSPYKRTPLIDGLLAGPDYARRMQIVFDVMLMERRTDVHVPSADWQEFLRDAFARNVPYDRLVRDILSADGTDERRRGAAKFYLDREGNANLLTRDVGRFFLGRDFQCAQCHDHPLIDDFKQAHYYGLFAFFNRGYAIQDTRGVMTFAEKAEGDVSFSSVFKKKIVRTTRPRLLDGQEAAEPQFAKGREYRLFPADKVRAIPAYSRRDQLPIRLASPEIPEFSRTIVNRLWALMMGRGVVHPPDLDHGENPPSHPELLEMLTREFIAMKFDVKGFLRELALTNVYQRSSEPPPGASPEACAPETFAVAALKPMTPEQIAWSLMQATDIVTGTRRAVEHQVVDLDPKFRDIGALDAKRKELAAGWVERLVFERLKGNAGPFVSHFGGAPGQPQDVGQSSVDQALFLANGEPVQSWLVSLIGRLNPITDSSALADELYLAILTRRPSADERAEVAKHLGRRADQRPQAIRELAWALAASVEFRFNH